MTMSYEDVLYYRQRAEREMEMARSASHPNAARAHSLLAGYYLDMVGNDARRSFGPPAGRLRSVA
jgi:hypothetical protein